MSSLDADGSKSIPALRPRLPSAERLLPYLRLIDATRVYTNWGPLSAEFEARVAAALGLGAGTVASASSGTSALVGAILAAAGRADHDRPLAIVPGFTFVATAVAVQQCGYRPYIVDVSARDWAMDPEPLLDHPELDRVGVVIPVAPFGRPVRQAGWRQFVDRTGIPVVIDGAASFDRLAQGSEECGAIPTALSFHATKCFSTGEGGCVVSREPDVIEAAVQALNFGFRGSRDCSAPSINGKMSEYHAAVGLAELDEWTTKLEALEAVADLYRRVVGGKGLADRLVTQPDIGASYVLLQSPDAASRRAIESRLDAVGVEHRLWYGEGLHRNEYFSALPRDGLPVTERLGATVMGLPLAPDLDEEAVARVAGALVDS